MAWLVFRFDLFPVLILCFRVGGSTVEVADVSRAYQLFSDVKRSTQFLMEYNDQFMFNEAQVMEQ